MAAGLMGQGGNAQWRRRPEAKGRGGKAADYSRGAVLVLTPWSYLGCLNKGHGVKAKRRPRHDKLGFVLQAGIAASADRRIRRRSE
jgi:hypothetical protein